MKHTRQTGIGFADHYLNQAGNGMPVFAGSATQRGHGIGNILKGLLRVATPLIKSVGRQVLKKSAPVLKEAGKRALTRGLAEMTSAKRPKTMRIMAESVRGAMGSNKAVRKKKKASGRGTQRGRASGRGRQRGRVVRRRGVVQDIFHDK